MLEAEFHAALELVGGGLEKIGKRLGGVERAMLRPPAQPFTFRQIGEGIADANADDLVIALGSPMSGKRWNVLQVTIGGRLWSSTVAGVGLLVVSGGHPRNAQSFGISAVVDTTFTTMPNVAQYSRGQIPVRHGEKLFLIVTGPTASTEYVAAATIEQYEDGNDEQVRLSS